MAGKAKPKPAGNVGGPNTKAVKDAATGLPKKSTPKKTKEAEGEVLNYDKEHKPKPPKKK